MSTKDSILTQQQLRELLRYDPATGLFEWWKAGPGRRTDRPAGCVHKQLGYRVIRINGILHYGHRLAMLYIYGEMPEEVDHKNLCRSDNSLLNIRNSCKQTNSQNLAAIRPSNKSSGLLGVSWCSFTERWRAQIAINGKHMTVGRFDSAEEAHQAYLTKKRELHEFCTI